MRAAASPDSSNNGAAQVGQGPLARFHVAQPGCRGACRYGSGHMDGCPEHDLAGPASKGAGRVRGQGQRADVLAGVFEGDNDEGAESHTDVWHQRGEAGPGLGLGCVLDHDRATPSGRDEGDGPRSALGAPSEGVQ